MTPLVQTCIVIVTAAFVALVATTIHALVVLRREAARLAAAAELSTAQVESIVREAQLVLASVREIVSPAQRVVNRFQGIGDRAADISAAILDEIEVPLFGAVALARGFKSGATRLLGLLADRIALHPTTHNGEHNHE